MSFQQYNLNPVLTPVRVVADSNQSGTYINGQLNNGVGATFTYSTGALTIDDVDVVEGDGVLLNSQTNANENGIYICTVTGAVGVEAVLKRRADFQSLEQMFVGQYVSVAAGTDHAGAMYALVEPKPEFLGISDLNFNGMITSGLGTAAAKAASDDSKAILASVNGTVIANRIACFTDTAGTIDDTTALATHAGNISAGLSGTAGTVSSFPATGAKGSLIVAAVANTGDTTVTVSNAAHGQASVVSIPDGGQATSNFLISNSAGTQTVSTGNLAFTAGYLQQSAVNALTAHAGGGQGSATALTRQINRVTTVASGGDSVVLPAAVAGRVVTVINAAASNAMDVFPASGQAINALTADTALSVSADTTAIFFCAVAGTWNSVVTA